MDFTIKKYTAFLKELMNSGYSFQTFEEFMIKPAEKVIVLRHDVDKCVLNSLKFANIQYELGIRGSYYFRIVPRSYNEKLILRISEMGHEIGYHYETMDSCKGDIVLAYKEFCKNLRAFRRIVPVVTICMHGSPRSKFDNKEMWQKYNYRDLGILAEPYFDVDFNSVFYITDTGRRFDGAKSSIRDKPQCEIFTHWPVYHSTDDIIRAIKSEAFPKKVLLTLHPQRWNDNVFIWLNELVLQKTKNVIKRRIVRKSKTGN
jgi:hypothetical protein